MTLGFIGIGTMASAMIEGLRASAMVEGLGGGDILLSPRGAARAQDLAARLPGVRVAASNQAVVDGCDTVILTVRPQIVRDVVTALRFRPGQRVISLVAATAAEDLRAWIGLDLPITRAVPLPFVATRSCVTPVFPPDPEALALFDRLGQAVPCASLQDFDLLAVASAMMGSYFGLLETVQAWLATQGLPEPAARTYLAGLFANLGQVARQSPLDFADLRHEFSTRGGLNEQVFRDFAAGGGTAALTQALDGVLARVRGRTPVPPAAVE
ncbi:pyrroline-5-carboxylate reductase [Rhodobacter sp. KR11]|uniref:pyrroline-5-carboxylate reductase n=1 Tax=Rhodobacter sp. KR11 TaxID=2974588 RepID=UPI00222178DC|nr:pyrroline-5-carboxylate reductase [Rhodobacter sp. KR11]MCW1919913.1 pyrroline-5-carboxylate reductase [Rhodobacter sp. KR11]